MYESVKNTDSVRVTAQPLCGLKVENNIAALALYIHFHASEFGNFQLSIVVFIQALKHVFQGIYERALDEALTSDPDQG